MEFTLYNRRVCVYIYLDYQQQTSRSIIVQCDLEKKIGYTNAEKKPMSYLQTILNQVRTYIKMP